MSTDPQIKEIIAFLKQRNLPKGESIWDERDCFRFVIEAIRDLKELLEEERNELSIITIELSITEERVESLEQALIDAEDELEYLKEGDFNVKSRT